MSNDQIYGSCSGSHKCCCHNINWTDAFNKFGFRDGDCSMTAYVAEYLTSCGYVVTTQQWGRHNEVIESIKYQDRELIPKAFNEDEPFGYIDPSKYLTKKVIKLLDNKFPYSDWYC